MWGLRLGSKHCNKEHINKHPMLVVTWDKVSQCSLSLKILMSRLKRDRMIEIGKVRVE